jgi:hypothetical protein
MALPVLEDNAEVVYHSPHNSMKTKLEDWGVEVIDGRPVTNDLADRLLKKGRYWAARLGISSRDELNLLAIFCAQVLSFVQTGLYMGRRPACMPHPERVFS